MKIRVKILILLALAFCGSSAYAQGSFFQAQAFRNTPAGIFPAAGATITICLSTATGTPCTPVTTVYSNSTLTTPVANPLAKCTVAGQTGCIDSLANFSFYAAPGLYQYSVSGGNLRAYTTPMVLPCLPAISGCAGSSSGVANVFQVSNGVGGFSPATGETYDPGLGQMNIGDNLSLKGPNPYADLLQYGGYASSTSSPPATTGTMTNGSPTLTLASPIDLANGHGVVVYGAGPATAMTTPGFITVTPINITGGAHTAAYKMVAEDIFGGMTAASAAGTTLTSRAVIGANTVSLTTCARVSGVTTYTSGATHNLQIGAQVNITGFGGGLIPSGVFNFCNGVKTIVATPSGTTFTVYDGQVPDTTDTSGTPVVNVFACNQLTVAAFSGVTTMRYWVYRSFDAGAYSLVGVAVGVDPQFNDCGMPAPTPPSYVSTGTPQASPTPQYLEATILSGGGGTALTLSKNAGNSETGGTVLHDNSQNVINAMLAVANTFGGGDVYVPSVPGKYWVFNGSMFTNTLSLFASTRLVLNNANFVLNQPWITRTSMSIIGEAHSSGAFTNIPRTTLGGPANPLLLLSEPLSGGGSNYLQNLLLSCGGNQQTCLLADEGFDGGGIASLVMDSVMAGGNGSSRPVIWKGGFGFFWNGYNCQMGNAGFVSEPCLRMTQASVAVTGGTPGQVPGDVILSRGNEAFAFQSGAGILIDCYGSSNPAGNLYKFTDFLFESQTAPFLRLNCPSGSFFNFLFDGIGTADDVVGFSTPFFDAASSHASGVIANNNVLSNQLTPFLVSGGNGAGLLAGSGTLYNINSNILNAGYGAYYTSCGGAGCATSGLLSTGNGGTIDYRMPATAAPGLAVGAGGAVPFGTPIPYVVQFVDINGNPGPASPSASATPTAGNQTVTVTMPTAPDGAVGWFPYRNGARLNIPPVTGNCNTAIPIGTTSFADSYGFTCGNSVPNESGGAVSISANGIAGKQLQLIKSGFANTLIPTTLTAARTTTLQDASGTVPLEIGSGNVTTAGTAVNTGTCQAQTGITVTNALVTDNTLENIGAALPATWQTGIVLKSHVTAAGTVTVYLCNPTAGNITPAATQVNVRVIR